MTNDDPLQAGVRVSAVTNRTPTAEGGSTHASQNQACTGPRLCHTSLHLEKRR